MPRLCQNHRYKYTNTPKLQKTWTMNLYGKAKITNEQSTILATGFLKGELTLNLVNINCIAEKFYLWTLVFVYISLNQKLGKYKNRREAAK